MKNGKASNSLRLLALLVAHILYGIGMIILLVAMLTAGLLLLPLILLRQKTQESITPPPATVGGEPSYYVSRASNEIN
jgi:hypothetical protein